MSFTFLERPGSGNNTKESYESLWRASGSDDPAYVRSVALSACPSIVVQPEGLLYRQDVDVQCQGHCLFFVTAKYGPRKKENGSYRLNFNTSGGTVRIKVSKASIQRYPPTAPDHKGLIGVTKDGPEGVDIVIPALKITVNFKHPLGVISLAQIKMLSYYTGCVNSDTFLTFRPGEVLFLGAQGSEGSDTETEVAYELAISRNALRADGTAIRVPGIEDAGAVPAVGPFYIDKRGHELLWISYEDTETNDQACKKPEGVYIERVYDTCSLSQVLGFGA